MGRYVPIDVIGSGGMGVVYRARDPDLNRQVALKVVRHDMLGAEGEARLVREAQAMAQVSHPNVITVLDVTSGVFGLVVAMELIDGVDLEGWLAQRRRSWREVLAVFVAAGRGLAAVHEAGLVHRDFKPANVLIEHPPAGRVLVTDFGLARGPGTTSLGTSRATQTDPVDTQPHGLTQTGVVMGTPAYMPPEQAAGAVADPPGDQYSFCVALWEGLCGARPHGPDDDRSVIPPWPSAVVVPRRVVAAIRRGLSMEPDRRFPSMHALLAELQPRAWGQVRWLGLGVLAVGVGATVAAAPAADAAGHCADASLHWDEQARARLGERLGGPNAALAAELVPVVVGGLDAYADDWGAAVDAVCTDVAAAVEGADLRLSCLADARRSWEGTLAAFDDPDESTLVHSLTLVDRLPSVTRCLQLDPGSSPALPDDPALATAVQTQQAVLARVDALSNAARFPEALALVEAVPDSEAARAYAPLRASALVARGEVYRELSREPEAAADFSEALSVATVARDDRTASRAANLLAFTIAFEQGRADDALPHARQALALAERVEPGGTLEAAARSTLAVVHDQAGDYEAALAEHRRAIDMFTAAGDTMSLGRRWTALATVYTHMGDLEAAYQTQERAVALVRSRLPHAHPELATAINNLAAMYAMAGQAERAKPLLEEAYGIRLQVFGPHGKAVGDSLCNLGTLYIQLHDLPAAVDAQRRGLAIFEEVLGPDHPRVAMALNGLAAALDVQGEYDEAIELMRRSLAIRVDVHGPDSKEVALLEMNLASTLGEAERWEESDRHQVEALRIYEKVSGTDSPAFADALTAAAERAFQRERFADAKDLVQRAMAIFEPLGDDYGVNLANGSYLLGRIEVGLGQPEAALAAHQRALALRQRYLGEHIDVMHAQRRVADLLAARGDDEEAQALYAQAWAYASTHDGVPPALAEHLQQALAPR